MNIHGTKMAEPLLPPSRFCRELGCQDSLSPHPLLLFPLPNLYFHHGKQASPRSFWLIVLLLFCSPFAQPLHTKNILCLTLLPSFLNPPKIHSSMIFQPPRSCCFPPMHTHSPPSFLFMCSRKPGGWCTTKRWAYLFSFVWESLAFLLSLVWVLVWLAWLIGL